MGAGNSLPLLDTRLDDPQKVAVAAPFSLRNPYSTTVWSLGETPPSSSKLSYRQAGQDVFCAGANVHGQTAQLLVRACAASKRHQPEFVVTWDDNKEFVGSTPTAPFAKLALYIGSLEVANGIKAFGFDSPLVQAALRPAQSRPPLEADPGRPALPSITAALQGLASSPGLGRLPRLRLNTLPDAAAVTEQRRGAPGQAPRALPPLTPDSAQRQQQRAQRWAGSSGVEQQSPRRAASLRDWHRNLDALGASRLNAAAAAAAAAASAQQDGGGHRSQIRSPARALEDIQAAANPAEEVRGRKRPAGPQRAAPAPKQARGWTGFTTYGLEMRNVLRAENPNAGAVEIEKLLGQRWAQLAPKERQAWSGRPAGHRRSLSGGTSSGGDSAQQQRRSTQAAAAGTSAGHGAEPSVHGKGLLYKCGDGGATPPSSYDSAKEELAAGGANGKGKASDVSASSGLPHSLGANKLDPGLPKPPKKRESAHRSSASPSAMDTASDGSDNRNCMKEQEARPEDFEEVMRRAARAAHAEISAKQQSAFPGFSLAKAGEMLRAEDSAHGSASQAHAAQQPERPPVSQHLETAS